MPSYPHYKVGDARPNDKLIILEDTNNDGKADKQITFADHLHLPIGFELAPEGVYVSQSGNLKLYTDTNNDDKYDKVEVILSGFDDHDTHHAISAFCTDPSGAIYMGEGTFLHSNVETAYGPVRGTNGGFMRYNTTKHHLERTQLSIPNPWGIAFDDWGQPFFLETSGPDMRWMMPGTIKSVYGKEAPASPSLIESTHMVRPTSGLEFISSRHFPNDVQGDFLLNNTIGFLGTKQHTIKDDTTGYLSKWKQDLVKSTDGNFRPVDLEFAPDGSLYIADWHNLLIGHMQHNARDPLRDHAHGRIYRITYPSRPLVTPPKVYGATIKELLDNLKLPEYRARYRSKRELRGRNKNEVLSELNKWISTLNKNDNNYEHHLLEALWVTWGINKIDTKLLKQLLVTKDARVRAAAVRALRYNMDVIPNYIELLTQTANDEHGRVRLETMVAASWLDKKDAMPILNMIRTQPLDRWMKPTYDAIIENFESKIKKEIVHNNDLNIPDYLSKLEQEQYKLGRSLYNKDGICVTCHQYDGKGVQASGYPSLSQTDWVLGDDKKLIKIVLHGLIGPITVSGKKYDGKTPMIPYAGLLNDKEIAAILTYVRNSFGNKSPSISEKLVKEVREQTKDKKGFYKVTEL
jgi:mono/diheme cytochrome c family protein/glucose/arabinose dehydrogenase